MNKNGLLPTDEMMSPEQMAAAQAKADKEQAEYEKRLAEKRARRENLSSIGMDDPLALPVHLLDRRFVYAFVNDKGSSLTQRQALGWEFVEDRRLSEALGQKEKGPVKVSTNMSDPKWAYLMRIERELYEEDRSRKDRAALKQFRQLEDAPEGLKFSKKTEAEDLDLNKESGTID